MISWLRDHGLALYGSITGTAALLISFFNYRHAVAKDAINLKLSHSPHPQAASNLTRLQSTDGEPWDLANLAVLHVVTVRNVGTVPVPLEDVGIVTNTGERKQSLVPRRADDPMILGTVAEARLPPLEPRSSRNYSVYLRRGEPPFSVSRAYAIDQTGKVWNSEKREAA